MSVLAVAGAPAPRAARPDRVWWCSSIGLVVLAQVAASGVRLDFARTHLEAEVEMSPDLPAGLVETSLLVGGVFGVVLTAVIGVLILSGVRRHAPRLTGAAGRLPFWLAGVVPVGLVLPDLLSAMTGVVHPGVQWWFWLVYLMVAVVASRCAPPPSSRGLRAVEVLVVLILPFC